MHKENRAIICLIIIALMLAACSAKKAKTMNTGEGSTGKAAAVANIQPPEAQLMARAISNLRNYANEPSNIEVRFRLESLLAGSPQSDWVGDLRDLLETLDRNSELQAQLEHEKQKSAIIRREAEREMQGQKNMAEQCAVENRRLQQENEELRNNIERLKNLEIELEKRENRRDR